MKRHLFQIIFASILILFLLTGNTSAIYSQAPAQQVLFSNDFEKGLAMPWNWETGWTVDLDNDNHVLHGAGHVWTTLTTGEELGDIQSFESRFNLLKGSLHVNYRISKSASRYFVWIESGRLGLFKMARTDTTPTELSSKALSIPYGVWHTLTITGIQNHLQVYLDGGLEIDTTDQKDPYQGGSIAFESLDGGNVLIDDVVLKGQPPTAASPGESWVFTGGPRGGIGYDIRFNPKDQNVIWVTDAFAGAHQSSDGGVTWIAKNQGIDARSGMSGDAIPVFSLAIDPKNPDVIWAGVMGVRGLYKSSDAGQTWVRKDHGIKDQTSMEMRGVTVDPFDSNTVYCGGNYLVDPVKQKQRGFIYRSKDGGENWELLIEPDALVRWIIVDPTDRNIIYASTGIFDRFAVKPTGVLKTIDGGKTWAQINNGFNNLAVAALAMDPKDHLTLIAGTGKAGMFADVPGENNGGVFITHDGGQNWRQVDPIKASGSLEIRFSAVAFAPSSPNIVYADSGNEFLRSEDGGETWNRYYTGPDLSSGVLENRGQPIALAVLPSDPDTIFMNAYDGGVFLSRDGGKTWTDSSSGYSGAQVWGLALDPQNPAFVVASSKNGVHASYNGGGKWIGRISDPWINNIESVAVDPQERNNILIGRSIDGRLFQSINGGFIWKLVLGPLGEDSLGGRRSIHKIVFAPSSPKIVYAATGIETLSGMGVTRNMRGPGIYKSTDSGATWSAVNQGLESTTLNIDAVAVHPQNPDIAYLGEMNSGVFKTLDGGKSWKPASNGLRQKDIRSLAIDPQNPETLYAGAEFGGLWMSENGGASWRNISAGMPPEASVRSIVIDPTQPNNLYVADIQTGVYRSTNSGAAWQQIRTGLKVKAIHALAISADGQTLYAGSEGNGVYRLDIGGRPPAALPEVTISDALGINDSPIAVDGLKKDWERRKVVGSSPAGNSEKDTIDLTNAYAFYDDKALYFLVETIDPKATYGDFDIILWADGHRYVCSVFPGSGYCSLGDITAEFKPLWRTNYSQFKLGSAFEGRFDLRDLGNPKSIQLKAINVMAGPCCAAGWHQADTVEINIPTPSEKDSWVNPLPEPTQPQVSIAPTALAQAPEKPLPSPPQPTLVDNSQPPAQKAAALPLLPLLGWLVLVILLVGFFFTRKKGKERKNENR